MGALQTRFGDEIVVCLDQAPYFYAKDLWKQVSNEKSTVTIEATSVDRVTGDGLQVWYFPPRLPQLNSGEQCWSQLDAWFNYRLIVDLDELQEALWTDLPQIDTPQLFNYFPPEGDREKAF